MVNRMRETIDFCLRADRELEAVIKTKEETIGTLTVSKKLEKRKYVRVDEGNRTNPRDGDQ